jgi:hypothetical protein
MTLSSSTVGMKTVGRSDIFDIVFHLTTVGAAQTDDSSRLATVYKCHAVQDLGFRSQRDHAHLAVLKPVIHPHQRSFPVKFTRRWQRHAVFCLVGRIFGWIELEMHALL